MQIEILYQDQYLLLCRKPAGVPSQLDQSGQEDLLGALQERFDYAGLVHRLDIPTGGVMVYALTPSVTGKLSALVQDHEAFCKEYLAVTAVAPKQPEGELTDLLFHDKRRNKSFPVNKKRGGSKEARLYYQTLAVSDDGHALIKVRLYTGRTHQIRVQFASRGMPLCGDGKYGSREKCPYIALWSYHTAFEHPVTHREVEAACLPPDDLYPWSIFDLRNI